MINSVMKKLHYAARPEIKDYKSADCREYLRTMSSYSCAYCTITENEAPGATFHIEHFRPQAKFPHLKNFYINLRYACPRCNMIKGSHWISSYDGCIRDCEKCNTKVCHENIFRLIDCLDEDPREHLSLKEDDTLESINGSKPATHTIKYLRLNRAQLIKLRRTRRFLDLWKQELETRREIIFKRIEYIRTQYEFFEEQIRSRAQTYDERKNILLETIAILFDMLSEETNYTLSLINEELNKVESFLEMRSGPDNADI